MAIFSFNQIKKLVTFVLILSMVSGPEVSYAQGFSMANLPEPGNMVSDSPAFVPVLVKGLIIHPDKPLNFDFLVDSGNDSPDQTIIQNESERMVRYFLAALTVPADQLWVNLSPYEKDRMVADDLGATDLGRDMLAQDYVLKQLTASLIYPEKELGKEFWARVYKEVQEKFGTTDLPVDTFNKVWIVPEKAEVFENGNAVYVTGAKLKVMLDSDYLAAEKGTRHSALGTGDNPEAADPSSSAKWPVPSANASQELAKQVVREVILPAIEREVNEGKNFATLRQIYHAAILAKWYRETIADTLIDKVYVGKNKIAGVDVADKTVKEQIYQRYIEAYKKGVFNYIKEEANSLTGDTVPRKYFSGGISDFAMKDVPLLRAGADAVRKTGEVFEVAFALRKPDTALFLGRDRSAALAQNAEYGLPPDAAMLDIVTVGAVLIGTGLLYQMFKKARAGEILPSREELATIQTLLEEQVPPGRTFDEILDLLPDAYDIWKRGNRFLVEERNVQNFKLARDADGVYRPTTSQPLTTEKVLVLGEYPQAFDIDAAMRAAIQHLTEQDLSLLREADEKDGFISKRARDDQRVMGQVVQIETALGISQTDAESKAAQVIADLNENRTKFNGEEVHILNGTGPDAKVVGRIDRSVAEKYGYIHETANVVLLSPDLKVIAQLRNKKNYDDHLAMYGGHLGVGEGHASAATEETLQETGLDHLATPPVFVGYESYDMKGDNNRERRSWSVKVLSKKEYADFQANKALEEKRLGISKKEFTRAEYKKKLAELWAEGKGEVVGSYEFTFDQLAQASTGQNMASPFQDKTNRFIPVEDEFKDGKVVINAFFTPDALDRLLSPENAALWGAIQKAAQADAAMISDELMRRASEDLSGFGIGDRTAIQFYAEALDWLNKNNLSGATLSIQQFAQRIVKIQPRLPNEALEGAIRKLAEVIHYDREKTEKLITDALRESVPTPVTNEAAIFGDYWASESEIASLKARIGRLADIKDSRVREQEVQIEAERLWGLHGIRSTNAHALFVAAFVELVSGSSEHFQNMRKALIEQNFEAKDSLKGLISSLSAVPLSDEEKLQILVGELMKVDDVTAAWLAAMAIRGMTATTDIERAVQEAVNKVFDTFPSAYKDRGGYKLSIARALSLVLRDGKDFKAYLFNNEVGVERVRETENPRPWKTYRELLSDKAMADPAMLSVWATNLPDPAALLAFLQSADQQRIPPVVVLFGTSVTFVTAMAYISNLWKKKKIKSSLEKLRDRNSDLEPRVAAAAYLTDVLAADKKKFLATKNAKEKDEYERELRNILWNLHLTGVSDPDYQVLRECIFGLAYFMEIVVIRDWLREIAERYKTANRGINLEDGILKLKLLADLEHDLALLDREWPGGAPPDNAMTLLNVSLVMNPGSTDLAMLDVNNLTFLRWLPVGTLALMITSYIMTRFNEGGVLIRDEADIADRVNRQGQTVVIGQRGFLEPEGNFRYLFDAALELLRNVTQEEILVAYQVKLAALEQWKNGKEVVLTAPPIKGVKGEASLEILQPVDSAMNPGGIDINNIEVSKQNAGAGIRFDDRAVEEILQGGFDGFAPVLINITPIESPLLLLGVQQEAATVAEI